MNMLDAFSLVAVLICPLLYDLEISFSSAYNMKWYLCISSSLSLKLRPHSGRSISTMHLKIVRNLSWILSRSSSTKSGGEDKYIIYISELFVFSNLVRILPLSLITVNVRAASDSFSTGYERISMLSILSLRS